MLNEVLNTPTFWGFMGVMLGAFITGMFNYNKTRLELSFKERIERIEFIKNDLINDAFREVFIFIQKCEKMVINNNHDNYSSEMPITQIRKLDIRYKQRWIIVLKKIENEFREYQGKSLPESTLKSMERINYEIFWFYNKQICNMDSSDIRIKLWQLEFGFEKWIWNHRGI